jgi:hypothetical protein
MDLVHLCGETLGLLISFLPYLTSEVSAQPSKCVGQISPTQLKIGSSTVTGQFLKRQRPPLKIHGAG